MRRAKGSKHCLESLACQFGSGASLEDAARDLKPNADHDVGSQLHIPHAHAALHNRFGDVHLEIRADTQAELSGGLRALNHKARPAGVRNRSFQELRERERQALDRIPELSLAGVSSSSKLSPSFAPTAAANSSMLWK